MRSLRSRILSRTRQLQRTPAYLLCRLDQAVKFAATMQYARRNVYVGATLKLPSSPRTQRCSGENFYCATAVPADIDEDYAATRMRLDAVCASKLVVTTGTIPEPRAQHWVRLEQPCTNADEFARAFESLVRHAGANPRAKDAARVMRLGGSVSYPDQRKRDKGYQRELTSVAVNEEAAPVAIETLAALSPGDYAPRTGGARRQAMARSFAMSLG